LDPRDTEWPITISRIDRPWHVEMHYGQLAPADAELHQLVSFITPNAASPPHPDASIRVPIHAIPQAQGEQWIWSDDHRAIRFKWPLDPAARRALRHYAFGRDYADPPAPAAAE
ncbi:MAG: hypothetical protein KDK70_35770, partial [Myxococcales bacterium]|nr:hypothetical protein [Myxococcales bacterium]